MKVKVVKEFLGLKLGEIGTVTNQDGKKLSENFKPNRAMWIKFNSKDLPVGICEPFNMHVKEILEGDEA